MIFTTLESKHYAKPIFALSSSTQMSTGQIESTQYPASPVIQENKEWQQPIMRFISYDAPHIITQRFFWSFTKFRGLLERKKGARQ